MGLPTFWVIFYKLLWSPWVRKLQNPSSVTYLLFFHCVGEKCPLCSSQWHEATQEPLYLCPRKFMVDSPSTFFPIVLQIRLKGSISQTSNVCFKTLPPTEQVRRERKKRLLSKCKTMQKCSGTEAVNYVRMYVCMYVHLYWPRCQSPILKKMSCGVAQHSSAAWSLSYIFFYILRKQASFLVRSLQVPGHFFVS
jgi:hypothetical protein